VVSWKQDHQVEPTLKITDMQLRRVASQRFQVKMPVWDNKQILRLKQKYVNRLGPHGQRQPATVFELLRELRRGHRGKREIQGSPSEYELTGIKALLQAGAEPGTGHQEDHSSLATDGEQVAELGVETEPQADDTIARVATRSCDPGKAVPPTDGDRDGPLLAGTLAALEGVAP
jgi:hypothetical protein